MKKQPTSVRWDEVKLNLVMEKEKLNSVQKVFTYLLDKYWWEHKIFVPTQSHQISNLPPIETLPIINKTKIKKSEQYFLNVIKNGFELPQEHIDFIQDVNDSDLPDRIKQNLITASRTIQS